MNIDTLDMFEELIASGRTDSQAKAEARLLAKISKPEIDLKEKFHGIDAKFNIVFALGGAIFLASVLPALDYYLNFRRIHEPASCISHEVEKK